MAGSVTSQSIGVAAGFQDREAKTLRNLGIFQIICGSLMAIKQIAATILAVKTTFRSWHDGGTGIWCGVLFVVVGVLGLLAGRNKHRGLAISYLVFVILNLGPGIGMIYLSTAEIIRLEPDISCLSCVFKHSSLVRLTIGLLILSVAIFITFIWGIISSSIIIHKTKACCCSSRPNMPPLASIIISTIPNSQTARMVNTPPQNVSVEWNGQPSQMYHQQDNILKTNTKMITGY